MRTASPAHICSICAWPRWAWLPGQADDANVIISPGLGTVDENGAVIEERMRLTIRATFAAMMLLRGWVERGPS